MSLETTQDEIKKPSQKIAPKYASSGWKNVELKSSEGYAWTDKWNSDFKIQRQHLQRLQGETVGDINKLGQMMGQRPVVMEQQQQIPEWDYTNPPIDKATGRSMNDLGEVLPEQAQSWSPLGKPFFGEGLPGTINKVKFIWQEAAKNKYGWDREPEEDRTFEEPYQRFFQALIGEYSLLRTNIKAGGASLMGGLQAGTEFIERKLGAVSLAQEEISTDPTSGLAPYKPSFLTSGSEALFEAPMIAVATSVDIVKDIATGQKVSLSFKPPQWIEDVVQRMSPFRNAEHLARTAITLVAGKKSFEDVTTAVKNNEGAARMAYSIGAGELQDVETFRARVRDGEHPYFVAQDMAQFGSELTGQMAGDPLNLIDFWAKPASMGLRVENVIQDVFGMTPELANVFDNVDDVISGAQALNKADEILDAYKIADNVKAGVITDIAQKFGLIGVGKRTGILRSKLSWWENTIQLTRTGAAKRHIASKSANHFLGHVMRIAKNDPDDVAEILVHIANLASDNREIARASLDYLASAVPDMRILFSEGGMEFGVILRNMLDIGDGTYDVQKISRGLKKILADGGEVHEIISYVNQTIGKTLSDIYPTIDELIDGEKLIAAGQEVSPGVQKFFDSGGKIRLIDKLINTGVTQPGILGIQREVAGRLFVGSNPNMAFRGATYDAVLTTLEMGPSVMMKNPRQWAELSEAWLGLEHAGLTQGFSKADIASMDTWAKSNSSYKTMGNLIDAIFNRTNTLADAAEVGMKQSVFDVATNTGGRLLQYFEVQNSQRIVGKATDDAMRHLIKTTMPKIDELVQAGLPKNIASALGERIINSFGDVEKARASLIGEIVKFQSVDKLKQMDWLDDGVKSLFSEFNDFNIWDNISDIIQQSDIMTKDEVIDGIRAIHDEFIDFATRNAATQHAMPNTHNEEVVEAVAGFIEEAADGGLDQAFVDETMDMVQANVNSKNAVMDALNNLGILISKKVRRNAERLGIPIEQVNPILDTLENTYLGSIKKATNQFKKATGRSQQVTGEVRKLSTRLLDSTETLADIRKDIKALIGLDVSELTSRSAIKDRMWRVWFAQRANDFATGRKAAVGQFWELIEGLKGTVPDEILVEIMQGSHVQDVIAQERIAIEVEQSIMVGGKLKPVGRAIRSFLDFGQPGDALRTLLAYINPDISFGAKGSDSTLLRVVNKYGGEYEKIDDIPIDEAFEALTKWRADNKFPPLINSLDELVGYKKVAGEAAEVVGEQLRFIDDIPSVVPPHDLAFPSTVVNAYHSKGRIDDAFEILLKGIDENYGMRDAVPADEELLKAINTWFDNAVPYIANHKTTASAYAQEMRDFILHDYSDKYAVDALMSLFYNFHFWNTRTMVKWGQRIPSNLGILAKYAILKGKLEELHASQPEWMRFSVNTNELLGLHNPNPIYFYLDSTFNPFQDMAGGFDDPDRRKNWYSTVIDSLGKTGTGSPSLIFQLATVMGLKAEGEDEAAAKFGGRLIPLSRQIKGLTSLLGINEGRGVELDPMVRLLSEAGFFSTSGRALDPYEQDRVARAANQVLLNNPDASEELLEQFWQHKGPLWDEAIAIARRSSAPGELASFFTGLTANTKGSDDILVNQFWTEYIKLVSQYENLSPEVYRKNYSELMQKYPFAEYMLLSRRGGDERDRSYAYMVLSRIEPGKTDDFSKAAGFDYDILGYFYDNKGDLTKLNEKDRTKFMTFISELGATLAIPDNATKDEWKEASARYGKLRQIGENLFGDDIWDRVDLGYELKGAGLNQSLEWQNYLKANPDVEMALQWQSEQIFLDPILSAYYGSITKLESYGTGLMYQKLEDKFGSVIFDTYNTWKALSIGGQSEEAKAYKRQHPEIKAYETMRDELREEIRDAVVEYGGKIPEGFSSRLQKELEGLSEGERDIIDFMEQPQTVGYTLVEWRKLIGEEAVTVALMEWNQLTVPEDIKQYLETIAEGLGMSYDEFILSIGQAP